MLQVLPRLFVISALFMLIFQLEARLISYVYLFHEGLLLIQSVLLGGGVALLGSTLYSARMESWQRNINPLLIPAALLLHLFVFFIFNSFVLNVITLGVLFGVIFYEISVAITQPSNRFYAVELLGSFIGVGLYGLGVMMLLEEYMLGITVAAATGYALWYTNWQVTQRKLSILLLVVSAGSCWILVTTNLPSLVHCSSTGNAFAYKAACLDESAGLEPVASYTHLAGRSDVYLRETPYDTTFLEVKNNGFRVSSANPEALRQEPWFRLLEHRIPDLNYPAGARVLSVGAGAGSYVQAIETYIENPEITAVEIDKTVTDIYQSGRFDEFLPALDSYELIYDEGRTYVARSAERYDVITIAIEGINSIYPRFVDERTGLLYTREALTAYIDHLAEGGALVLEQYYPESHGDAQAVKFLSTLQAAAGDSDDEFKERLLLYTWAFHPYPGAQRYIAAVYKPEGFTERDVTTTMSWVNEFETFYQNPHRITAIHSPRPSDHLVFDTYFDEGSRAAVAENYNVSLTTDEKPFRHTITTLPFPMFVYAAYILFAALIMFVFAILKRRQSLVSGWALLLSALFGLLTFGLQYLLFYKTAAFIHPSLIFFSIYLLIPLSFGALGGYCSTFLTSRQLTALLGVFAASAITLASLDIFITPIVLVLVLSGVIFFFSGFLFPLILSVTDSSAKRMQLYAVNLIAGGFAIMIIVTAHATVGWTVVFYSIIAMLTCSLLVLTWVWKA